MASLVPNIGGNGVTVLASTQTFHYPSTGGVNPSTASLQVIRSGLLTGTAA